MTEEQREKRRESSRRNYKRQSQEYKKARADKAYARIKERMESDPEYAERQRRLKRIRDSRRDREKVNEARRLHYAKNRKKCRAKQKAWRTKNAESFRKYLQSYRSRPEFKAKAKAWRESHKEELKEYKRKYNREHQSQIREKRRRDYQAHLQRMQTDPAYREAVMKVQKAKSKQKYTMLRLLWEVDEQKYAEHRARERVRRAKKAIEAGRTYKPRYSVRIPNTATMRASHIDPSSLFCLDNLTPSQRAAVKDFCINHRTPR